MSYVKKTLVENEHIVYAAKKHWYALFGPALGLLFGLLVSLIQQNGGVLFIIALCTIMPIARYFLDEFVITNKRVILKTGIFSQNVNESPLHKLNYVNVKKSLVGRILGYGTIYIQTAAKSGEAGYAYIANPEQFRDAIFKQ